MTPDPTLHSDPAVPLTLADDLNALSSGDIERVVVRVCSAYGTVMKVALHRSNAHQSVRAFALVDMSCPEEAERLAVAFNRQRMGPAVLLLLKPQSAS